MEIRLLKMFCAIADDGSIAAAAARLHLTPSALSHGIKGLETELGTRLFERAGRKLLLNQAGEQLLDQIRPLLDRLENAKESLKKLGKWGQTRLRVGAADSACQHILPRVIRELKKAHPQTELQVESGDMSLLVNLIHHNKVDLALGVASDHDKGLDTFRVFEDELMFVFAPSHRWAAERSMARDELRTQPFILYQRSSSTSKVVDDYFRKLDIVPSTVMEIANIEAIKELVKLDLGVSVLAPWVAEEELNRGTLKMRPLGAQPLRRRWVVASLAGRRLGLVQETFIRLCRTETAGMRLDRKDVGAPMRRSSSHSEHPRRTI